MKKNPEERVFKTLPVYGTEKEFEAIENKIYRIRRAEPGMIRKGDAVRNLLLREEGRHE